MSVVFNAATAANVSILRSTNGLFQLAQKRVSTGKAIFGAADDATKYTMSETMLSRSKNLDALNSNISTALKALESTDKTLTQIKGLLDQMSTAATNALNASGSATLTATTTANINESTAVAGAGAGHRLSITADNGRNFTYTFAGAAGATNWGQVAQALSSANIGVTMRFQTNGTATNVVLESTDGKTGFTIDGSSSQQVVGNLTGLNSGYDGAYNASRFTNGTSSPTGFGGSTPVGMRFGLGGIVTTASTFANSSVAAGTSLTFQGSDGVARTWSTSTVKNIDTVLSEINGLNAGVKAELVQSGTGQYRVSLRNLNGDSMIVLNGTGIFDPATGAGRFNGSPTASPVVQGNPLQGSPNSQLRLTYGQNLENYKADITGLITNNVTPAGRNLLRGENIAVLLNEFSANALTVSGVNTAVTGNLNLTTLGTTWNTVANIQASKTQITAAQTLVTSLQAQFGAFSSTVKERLDLNKDFASNIKSLGDDLVSADVSEESAKLTALQTQQQFAVQAFSAGSQNAQGLLRLLG